MTQKRYTEIPKRQKCINKEEPYIGGAKDILDDELNKPQSQVNDETNQRVTTLEESVAPGGSIDERITVEKNRAEQAEGVLDGKVATEKQRAEGVEGGLNTRLQTVEQLAEISVGGGDIGIGTAADFESDDPSDLAKVPTISAILGSMDDEPTAGSDKLVNSSGASVSSALVIGIILNGTDTVIGNGSAYRKKDILVDYKVSGGMSLNIQVNSITSSESTAQSRVYFREKLSDNTYKTAMYFSSGDSRKIQLDENTVAISVSLYATLSNASVSEAEYVFDYSLFYDTISDTIKGVPQNINALKGNTDNLNNEVLRTIKAGGASLIGAGANYDRLLIGEYNINVEEIEVVVGNISSSESITQTQLVIVESDGSNTLATRYFAKNTKTSFTPNSAATKILVYAYATLTNTSVQGVAYNIEYYNIYYADNVVKKAQDVIKLNTDVTKLNTDIYNIIYSNKDVVVGTGVAYQKNNIAKNVKAGETIIVKIGTLSRGDVRIQQYDVEITNVSSLPDVSHRIKETTCAANSTTSIKLEDSVVSLLIVENLGASATSVGTEYIYNVYVAYEENILTAVNKTLLGTIFDDKASVTGNGQQYQSVVVVNNFIPDKSISPILMKVGNITSTADVTKTEVDLVTVIDGSNISHYCKANSEVLVDVSNADSVFVRVYPARGATSVASAVYNISNINLSYYNAVKEQSERNNNILQNFTEDYIPDYWKDALDSDIEDIQDNILAANKRQTTFAFVTDVHYPYNYKNSPRLIREINKRVGLDLVVCGGDIIDYEATKDAATEIFYEWENKVRDLNCITVRGNHDDNHAGSSGSEGVVSEDNYYSIFCKQIEKDIDTGCRIYFYADNKVQKIRYIFLDTDNNTISNSQLTWFKEALTSLESGWTCIIFCHMYFEAKTIESGVSVLPILSCGTAINDAIDEVFDSMNAIIAALIVGHVHKDYSIQSEHNYPIIATTTDANGTKASQFDTNTRTGGTTTEQAFDVFTIDLVNRTIKSVRVGAGSNREFSY